MFLCHFRGHSIGNRSTYHLMGRSRAETILYSVVIGSGRAESRLADRVQDVSCKLCARSLKMATK